MKNLITNAKGVWVDNGRTIQRTDTPTEPIENQPPKENEQPPANNPNEEVKIWNDPIEHFNHFANMELSFGFSTKHVIFGIVQMIQREINLIHDKLRIATPLQITGEIDEATIEAFKKIFDKQTASYLQVYNFIEKKFPEAHMLQM